MEKGNESSGRAGSEQTEQVIIAPNITIKRSKGEARKDIGRGTLAFISMLGVVGVIIALMYLSSWFRNTQLQKIYSDGSEELTPTITQVLTQTQTTKRAWNSAGEPEKMVFENVRILPTRTALPTKTLIPTLTIIPTNEPLPSPTYQIVIPTQAPPAPPAPTKRIYPTFTPYPTYTALPTLTPYPTFTQTSTFTPTITLTPIPSYTVVPTKTVTPNPNLNIYIYLAIVLRGEARKPGASATPTIDNPYP